MICSVRNILRLNLSHAAVFAPHSQAMVLAGNYASQVNVMQTVMNGYRGISLLLGLNSDRLFTVFTLVAGLLAGAYLGHLILLP
jgi:hypothetical protein